MIPARLRSLLPLAAVALVGIVMVANPPAPARPATRSPYVMIVGAPGLRWEDLSPSTTPSLWRLAAGGSVGALAVRSASRLTCPLDGWVTLGAGNLAEWDQGRSGSCPSTTPTVIRPDRFGGRLVEQPRVVDHNREQSYLAQPGALAESVRCTTAVGTGAAVAAARPVGRVDRYLTGPPAAPSPAAPSPADPGLAAPSPADRADPAMALSSALSECPLSIVDAGSVSGEGSVRADALTRVDASVAAVLAARPPGSLVLVAGLADTEAPARLHLAIADGPGFAGGWLTSPSTGRAGYVQLYDLAPTALAALGRPSSSRLFAGAAARSVAGRPADLAEAVAELADGDARAGARRGVAGVFLPAVAVLVLLALAAVPPVLWRVQGAGPRGPRAVSPRLRRATEVTLLAAALALPAALVADFVPWWRGEHRLALFVAVWLAALASATAAAALLGRARRRGGTLRPATAGAGLAAAVVVADVIGSGWSHLGGVSGYSSVDVDRYTGIGAIGLGVLLAGLFVLAGCVAQRVGRAWRLAAFALLGWTGAVVVGSPYLGADPAGAVALALGVCVAVTMLGWPAVMRVTVAVACVAVLSVCLAAVRPNPAFGRLLAAIGEGSAGPAIQRIGAANVMAVADSPFTVLAGAGALFVFAVLLQPWGGLRRVLGLYPALRAALVGLVVAAVLGGLLGGTGLVVAGAAVATALPIVTLAALRALAGAGERTIPYDLNGSGRIARPSSRDTAPVMGDRGRESVTVKSRGSLDLDLA